ncbi:YceD family protein [Brevundimonas sp. 2R-24]|uniref:YceD family protein n=1 Tax=Peiella sedimenti TaxID=3061083 RepID=A0ABT8SLG3_9CAUL|nr:YceD family protein [Caulobacteraceae bacterium XZ-24]
MNRQPWTYPVPVGQIRDGLDLTLEAEAGVRERIARHLGLEGLDALTAQASVKPTRDGWRLTGSLDAHVIYRCGVSLEPFPAEISEAFEVNLTETPPEPTDGDFDPEAPEPPDVIESGVIDVAAYVVEQLSLALDPWPRKPGVEFEAPEPEAEPSPFAVLAKLKSKDG